MEPKRGGVHGASIAKCFTQIRLINFLIAKVASVVPDSGIAM